MKHIFCGMPQIFCGYLQTNCKHLLGYDIKEGAFVMLFNRSRLYMSHGFILLQKNCFSQGDRVPILPQETGDPYPLSAKKYVPTCARSPRGSGNRVNGDR